MNYSLDIFNHIHEVDFGTVTVNTTSKKVFEVKNRKSISQVYKVERYLDTPKLDSGFKVFPPVSAPVKPGEVVSFKIEFTPLVVNMRTSDYFVIRHLYGVEATVLTKATVDGPECSLSCTLMRITCPYEVKKYAKKFEIRNFGNCTVFYHIVVDNDHSPITLSPYQGKIQSSKSICVTATFTPSNYKPLFKRVFCLIENHEPLVLDIYALWLKKDANSSFDSVQESLPQYKNTYHCFMNNLMREVILKELPLISMDVYYLDFKNCTPKMKKQIEFSLTNNYSKKLVIIWDQDVRKVFTIEPSTVEINVSCCVTFKAWFQPLSKDKLFSAELEAQVLLNDQIVPFPVYINLKGHSFDESSCGWAPQYKVEPRHLILPPCMSHPFHPSHSTLNIHRIGHLPMAFKFHSPENSNFLVKPQQGLIQEKFQTVLVQFQPSIINDMICTEKWMLSFNSNENVNQCIVEFGGSIETPQIIVNDGHTVIFPKVHPQSPTSMAVDLYNPTRFSFWYNETVVKGDTVLMAGTGGEIWPNEHKKVIWTFCPQGVGYVDALVSCTPSIGVEVKVKPTNATVRGICEETTLQVIPHGLIYENVLSVCEHQRGFEITNTGEAIISGTLMWLSEEGCTYDDIRIRFEPDTFNLQPGNAILINVFITPLCTGTKQVLVGYSINETTATPLIPVYIKGVFPCLQISDIRINNTGPLFTKLDFCKALKINELNEILRTLKPDELQQIEMHLPTFMCICDVITVELMLENVSDIAVGFQLHKENKCDCKPKLIVVSFSVSQWRVVCPHKSQFNLSPMAGRIEAQNFVILHLDVHYSTVGLVECLYSLIITPEDYESVSYNIKLNFDRISIPEGMSYLDSVETKEEHNFVFNMNPVFIGDCYPYVQAFYIYNNTILSLHYEISDKNLVGTPFKYVGDRSTVSPLSNHALLFTFLPNSSETYEAFVDLTLDSNTTVKLLLRGTGLLEQDRHDVEDLTILKSEKLNLCRPSPVFLSTAHIDIGPMKQSCAQRHVIFFNNKTRDIFSFKWHITKLPNVVELRVHPSKGAVQPGGAVEFRVVAYSKGWPCELTCSLTCIYASFSKYSSMVQKIKKYREDSATCADYFIITESGTENIELAPPYEVWPRKKYLTVSVSLSIKYDALGNDSFHPFSPSTVTIPYARDSFLELNKDQKLSISHFMETVLWETLDGLRDSSNSETNTRLTRYIQLTDTPYQTDVAVPSQIMKACMEDILYSACQEIFQLTHRNSTEHLRRTLLIQLQQCPRICLNSDDSNTVGLFGPTSAADSLTS